MILLGLALVGALSFAGPVWYRHYVSNKARAAAEKALAHWGDPEEVSGMVALHHEACFEEAYSKPKFKLDDYVWCVENRMRIEQNHRLPRVYPNAYSVPPPSSH